METVLVTAVGSFSAHIVINNLKQMGYKVIGCDIYPKEWVVNSNDVDEFFLAPYATNETEYIGFIKDLCKKENVRWIFPLTDIEVDVFSKSRGVFNKIGVVICISAKDVIETCRDKYKLSKFINNTGASIKTIPTFRFVELQDKDVQLPVICKVYNGRSSQGLRHIKSLSEWNEFLTTEHAEQYIIQPYIKGIVVTVDIVRDIFGNCVAIPRKELLRTLNGAGTTVYVYRDNELEKTSIELASLLNVIGCVNFEFILDNDGTYHFLECNPRFSGGVVFSCMAGYNCVENNMRVFQDKPIKQLTIKRNFYIARRYESHILKTE